MATRTWTKPFTQLDSSALLQECAGLLQGDDGAWLLLGHYNDKCVHVWGVWGGAVVTVQGTNEDAAISASNFISLTDPTQTTISFTQTAIKQVLENPLYIRVKVAGGDGTTNLTARLLCRN